jgi:ParB/RepB/Spo0J family partition protein
MPKQKPPPKEYAQGGADGGIEATADANPSTQANITPQAQPDQPAATFMRIPLGELATSPTNPRKHFDPAKLQEMADTITASDVHTPILVRPLSDDQRLTIVLELNRTGQRRPDDATPQYEIVSGERRYRASKLAHAPTIPAMVRNLTDAQVLEIQLTENLQREDLTALEEAEGYDYLLTETGISAVQLAAKIGKSVRYVFNRLKLQDCCAEVKQALRAGTIDASRALLLATVPSAVQQKRGLAEALKKNHINEPIYSLRMLTDWVKQNLMLKIADAAFSTTSASLVPSAGACTQCPKRTGANADLFDDVIGKNTPDLCTDTTCWSSKAEAHRDQLLAKARATGQKIIEGAEAQEITNRYHEHIDGYTPLKDGIEIGDSETSVRDYIHGQKIDVVIIENPHKKTFTECVADDALDDLMRERGHLGGQGTDIASQRTAAEISKEIDKVNRRIRAATTRKLHSLLTAATTTALHKTGADQVGKLLNHAPLLRAWLHVCNDQLGGLSFEVLGMPEPGKGTDHADAVNQHIARSDTTALQRMVLAFAIEGETSADEDNTAPLLDVFTTQLKIDKAQLATEALASVQENYYEVNTLAALEANLKTAQTREAAQAKAGKAAQKAAAKPQKQPAKNAPLAQPEGVGGGTARPAAKPGKPKAAPKPKTTTQEAITGIADALQNIEAPPADGAAPLAKAPTQPQPKATAKTGAVPVEAWPFPHAKKP